MYYNMENERQVKMASVSSIGVIDTQPKGTSVLKGTIIAGAIGGGLNIALNTGFQYGLIKSPKYREVMKQSIQEMKELYGNSKNPFKKYMNWCGKQWEKAVASNEAGKFNFKAIGKFAAIGTSLWAGVYLAYRGIKALVTKNNND